MHLRKLVIYRNILGCIALVFWATGLGAASSLTPEQLDQLILEIRTEVFNESPDRPGIPNFDASQIDRNFVEAFYRRPGALDAIQRIFSSDSYNDINSRMGVMRNQLNLECWAIIADRYGIDVELNNAGKDNGAISDLDNTAYTTATRLWDPDTEQWIEGAEAVHKFIIEKHTEVWRSKTNGLTPLHFDCMHFSGSGMMQDWRMTKHDFKTFLAQLDADIARLSATEGAYWVPGGYKEQVYQRYINEGRTYRIEPIKAGQSIEGINRIIIEGAPENVIIHPEAPTAQVSELYRDVPGEVDHNAAWGAVAHNDYFANQYRNSPMKNGKYSVRFANAATKLVNLVVNFRELQLQGKEKARRQMVTKLFSKYAEDGLLHPDLQDPDELMRVIDEINRIELDKIIRAGGIVSKEGWSDYWQNYEPQDINQPEIQVERFAKEIQEIRRDMPDIALGRTDLELAEMAQGLFVDKVRSIGRAAAAIAAKETFQRLFTQEGYVREVYLHGEERAKMQIAERLRGLHAQLAFQVDERIFKDVVEAAPPEVRETILQFTEIVRSQREAVMARKAITVEELRESTPIIEDIINRLKADSPMLRVDPEASLERVTLEGHRERIRMELAGGTEAGTHVGTSSRSMMGTAAFFDQQLGLKVNMGYLHMKDSVHQAVTFQDIGSFDTVGKVYSAWVTGNRKKAEQEARDAIIGIIFDKYYDVPKNFIEFFNEGKVAPIATYFGVKGADWLGDKFTLGPVGSYILALYSMEKALGEIGWHFYGAPTEREVVSWVLTGHPSRGLDPEIKPPPASGILDTIGQAITPEKESRFPGLPESAIQLLEKNALLKTKVPIPESMSSAEKTLTVKSITIPRVNNRTRKAGYRFNSYDHLVERDRLKNIYLLNGDYWIRRNLLYQTTHIDFFRYAEHRNPKWQGFYKDPPGAIADRPLADIKAEFADAYQPIVKGKPPLWNYEQVYLRLYFQEWLDEWKATQPEYGHFIQTANSLTFDWSDIYVSIKDFKVAIWNWEKAVVDELINIYRAGELYNPNPPTEDDKRIDQERARRDAMAKNSLSLAAEKVMKEVGAYLKSKLTIQNFLESLLWGTGFVKSFAEDVIEAGDSLPPYQPQATQMRVKVHRPVAKVGGDIPMEILARGDIKQLPQDFKAKVEYQLKRSIEGRPPLVLKDDVKMLLGKVMDDQVLAHEIAMRVTATSPSNPDFSYDLGVETVYLIEASPDASQPVPPPDRLVRDNQDVLLGQVEIDDPRIGFDVNSLVGLPILEAIAILDEIKLVARPVAGSPASGENQYGHVEAAQALEIPLQPGSQVQLSVFREAIPTAEVPALLGKHLQEAGMLIRVAGLKLSAKQQGPAPLPNQVGMVVNQEPGHLTKVKPGSEVTVYVYGNYQEARPTRDLQSPTVSLGDSNTGSRPGAGRSGRTSAVPVKPEVGGVPELTFPTSIQGLSILTDRYSLESIPFERNGSSIRIPRPSNGYHNTYGDLRSVSLWYQGDNRQHLQVLINWLEAGDTNMGSNGQNYVHICQWNDIKLSVVSEYGDIGWLELQRERRKLAIKFMGSTKFIVDHQSVLKDLMESLAQQIESYAVPCR